MAADYTENQNSSQEQAAGGSAQVPKDASAKLKHKSRVHKVKKGFYYSFLTLVLLFCLIQVSFGAILNISKTISYRAKIKTLEKVRDEAEIRNQDLKYDIKQFSTTASLEGIARNNLKMAGEDELLVIINKEPKETDKTKKKK